VRDVEDFPDHIACDSESKSEVVVPIVADEGGSTGQRLVAIIDIDCAVLDGFDEQDRKYLEELAAILSACCTWPSAQSTKIRGGWWWFR
jgi:L-methionine (R)-S-oxide reductase